MVETLLLLIVRLSVHLVTFAGAGANGYADADDGVILDESMWVVAEQLNQNGLKTDYPIHDVINQLDHLENTYNTGC